jgi:hypothetical protein
MLSRIAKTSFVNPRHRRPIHVFGSRRSVCQGSNNPQKVVFSTSEPLLRTIRLNLERWGYLDAFRHSIRSKICDRLEHPRFGFPGVHDRAPPPPKTLHWRYAPAEGEYEKIRAILVWSGIHIWLIRDRIGNDPRYSFLEDSVYDYLYNELISQWLPEASIPSFSIKSEGKLLVDELKDFVDSLHTHSTDPNSFASFVSSHALCASRSTPEFLSYITKQRLLLAQLDLPTLIENPSSWSWDDSLD